MAIRIYIASPYSNGDKEENVNLQMDIAEELMQRGFAPYTPLLTHFQHLRHPREEHDWYKLDNEFLSLCDILIRIKPIKNGKEITSVGADKEEMLARELKIPVFSFNTLEEMCVFLDEHSFEL
jgi:nucleoside 2-deoxyribosyltransferase